MIDSLFKNKVHFRQYSPLMYHVQKMQTQFKMGGGGSTDLIVLAFC